MLNFMIKIQTRVFSNPTKKLRTSEILKTAHFFHRTFGLYFTYFIVLRYDIVCANAKDYKFIANHTSDCTVSHCIAVFVKIVDAECALSNVDRVLTQVNSLFTMTTIFEQKTV